MIESIEYKTGLLNYLSQFATENKKQLFNNVLSHRTRYLTVVLEDIYQAHNASAVLRSCDCFGIQDVHIIENKNNFNVNTDVALGSLQWLDLINYPPSETNTLDCINSLKSKGYKIAATTPHKNDFTINNMPLNAPVALFFGTERRGLSSTVIDNADMYVQIPMYGFTESLNISVSAAIALNVIKDRLLNSANNWHLSEKEDLDIRLRWMKHILKKSDLLEKEFGKTFKI